MRTSPPPKRRPVHSIASCYVVRTLSEKEWQRGLDLLASIEPMPEFAIASGSLATGLPDDFYARFARVMRERGARVIIDTSGQPLIEAVRAGVFLIKPNLREMRALTAKRCDWD